MDWYVCGMPKDDVRASERQGGEQWLDEVKLIIEKLDHAETLHADTMRFQYTYAAEDLGHLLAQHRAELMAALTPSQPAHSADAAMARWAVEFLDAWADAVRDEQRGNFTYQIDGKYFCAVKSGSYGHCGQYRGDSPDAARIAAAKALREADPSLPAPPGGGK